MNILKKSGFILLMGIALLGMTSCGSDDSSSQSLDQKGKEYTSEYICPMHCEGSGSETKGTCPVCGMDYVKNNNK